MIGLSASAAQGLQDEVAARLYKKLLRSEVASGRLDQAEAPAQVRRHRVDDVLVATIMPGRARRPVAVPAASLRRAHRSSLRGGASGQRTHGGGPRAPPTRCVRRVPCRVQLLGSLCDRVRFSPEAALELHKSLYKTKLMTLVRACVRGCSDRCCLRERRAGATCGCVLPEQSSSVRQA